MHALASRIIWPQPKASSETDFVETFQANSTTNEVGLENQSVIPLVQIPTADIPSKTKPQKNAPEATQPSAVLLPVPQEPPAAPSVAAPPVIVLEATEERVEISSQPQARSESLVDERIDEKDVSVLETLASETDELDAGELEREAFEQATLEQAQDSQQSESVQLEKGVLVSLTDFPHLSGAESGCFGLDSCHRSQGSYRTVVQQLTAQMRQNGYQLVEKEDIDGAGHRVFEVIDPSNPDDIYYLNVFSDGLDSAVYALTAAVLSLEELKNLNA